ncbi:hypothetical protein AQUCO_02400144v1 [Aquilegia coerulea]|uniref:Glycosyl hydrolase family 38 C-terminal domain-containing protein n=1 Tax=Aquilegia coerulea TaxID=218851 RepID=A0A2G5DBI6_AQUCA|nr:hypothetical protein AQUCO_02400144v1 [Aquilegia coerulea]
MYPNHYILNFQVGPIPIDDGIGKEVATQITTTMKTNKTFYTDSNGRDFIKRINLGLYMEDSKTELSVLVDRSVGGSSLADGQMELMLHSYCPPSEVDLPHGKNLVIVVYNSLGWQREDIVRIPVSTTTLHFLNFCSASKRSAVFEFNG